MTSGTLVTLALAATGLLVVGARLIEDPSTTGLVVGLAALILGTAVAATAVAAAWRAPRPAVVDEDAPAPARPRGSALRKG